MNKFTNNQFFAYSLLCISFIGYLTQAFGFVAEFEAFENVGMLFFCFGGACFFLIELLNPENRKPFHYLAVIYGLGMGSFYLFKMI